MRIKPTYNRVLILPDEVKSETESGLTIPEDGREKPVYGVVVDVGPDCNQVKVGDRAIFLRKSGVNPVLDGKEHIIMVEGDVLGVLIENNKQYREVQLAVEDFYKEDPSAEEANTLLSKYKNLTTINSIITTNMQVGVFFNEGVQQDYRVLSSSLDSIELMAEDPINPTRKISLVATKSIYNL